MQHLLTIELLLGILLVTTFTSVGLLGLWAATSRWHWFVRAAVVLGILSVLLLRPMYEPFFIVFAQVATIVIGVAVYRHGRTVWFAITDREWQRLPRFSLAHILLFIALTAAVAATNAAAYRGLLLDNWLVLAGVGSLAGATTLCGAWLYTPHLKWYWRCATLLILVAMFGVGFWVISGFALIPYAFDLYTTGPVLAISGVMSFILQCMFFLVWIWASSINYGRGQWLLRVTAIAVVAAFPSFVLLELLNPLPIPADESSPVDNTYDELVQLGNRVESSQVLAEWGAETLDYDKLISAIESQQDDVAELQDLLERPCEVLRSYDSLPTYENQRAIRSLGYLLNAQAISGRRRGNADVALAASLDGLHLASRVEVGGFTTDWWVAFACRGMAVYSLYRISDQLDAEQCKVAQECLRNTAFSEDEMLKALHREQILNENLYGWYMHLFDLFERVAHHLGASSNRGLCVNAFQRDAAVSALLAAELACHEFRTQRHRLPTSLSEMVPDQLPSIPIDPYDAAGLPLMYKLLDDGFLIYSVGPDRVDDGGRPAPPLSQWLTDQIFGDIHLDAHFGPDEEAI
jgi:hypothetical protein